MRLKKFFSDRRPKKRMRVDLSIDDLGVRDKNTSFLNETKFEDAWSEACILNREGWSKTGKVPDIRWRAHVCCWAATHALSLDGDFVECGVHTGLLSLTVCNYVNFGNLDRTFWLFDTFNQIPLDNIDEDEVQHAEYLNSALYFDVYEYAQRNFRKFDNTRLVRGRLPESLVNTPVEKIAYLSIDLNNASSEESTINALWPKLVKGAIIVLDDYAFAGYEKQYAMWNNFAEAHGKKVLTLPTGQGLSYAQKLVTL